MLPLFGRLSGATRLFLAVSLAPKGESQFYLTTVLISKSKKLMQTQMADFLSVTSKQKRNTLP